MIPEIAEHILREVLQPWEKFAIERKRECLLILQGIHVDVLSSNHHIADLCACTGTNMVISITVWGVVVGAFGPRCGSVVIG